MTRKGTLLIFSESSAKIRTQSPNKNPLAAGANDLSSDLRGTYPKLQEGYM